MIEVEHILEFDVMGKKIISLSHEQIYSLPPQYVDHYAQLVATWCIRTPLTRLHLVKITLLKHFLTFRYKHTKVAKREKRT